MENDWNECVAFHGHSCPGLAIGFRAALHALDVLDIPLSRAKDEELVCISENDACGVDAIQFLTGCTAGKGNLIFLPYGKMAYTFFDRQSGRGIRLVMRNFDRSQDRKETMNKILNSPVEELFDCMPPQNAVPEKARIFNSVRCESCGELCREDKIRLQEGRMTCLACLKPYDRG